MPVGKCVTLLLAAVLSFAWSCTGTEPSRTPQVAPTATAREKPPPKPGPLNGRELAVYAELVESYPLAEELVEEADRRRTKALALLEEQPGAQAEGFASHLMSAAPQLSEARARISGAASHFDNVSSAVEDEFRTVAAERSYQALHDAVTETIFIVLDMVAIVGNTIGACEASAAGGGPECAPEVLAAVQPIEALDAQAEAAQPSLSEAFEEADEA